MKMVRNFVTRTKELPSYCCWFLWWMQIVSCHDIVSHVAISNVARGRTWICIHIFVHDLYVNHIHSHLEQHWSLKYLLISAYILYSAHSKNIHEYQQCVYYDYIKM